MLQYMCAFTLSLARAVRWLGASVFENFGVDAATRDETLSSSETARLAAVLSSHRLSPARNDRRFPNQNQASNCWCVLSSRLNQNQGRGLSRCCLRGRTAFNEYQLCTEKRGKTDTVCLQRGRDYLSVCPEKWVRAHGFVGRACEGSDCYALFAGGDVEGARGGWQVYVRGQGLRNLSFTQVGCRDGDITPRPATQTSRGRSGNCVAWGDQPVVPGTLLEWLSTLCIAAAIC